jgi:hypothetical protein
MLAAGGASFKDAPIGQYGQRAVGRVLVNAVGQGSFVRERSMKLEMEYVTVGVADFAIAAEQCAGSLWSDVDRLGRCLRGLDKLVAERVSAQILDPELPISSDDRMVLIVYAEAGLRLTKGLTVGEIQGRRHMAMEIARILAFHDAPETGSPFRHELLCRTYSWLQADRQLLAVRETVPAVC